MGITEETDAVVIVVSEETATISVVMAGEMMHGLAAPRLRVVLRDVMRGEKVAEAVGPRVVGRSGGAVVRGFLEAERPEPDLLDEGAVSLEVDDVVGLSPIRRRGEPLLHTRHRRRTAEVDGDVGAQGLEGVEHGRGGEARIDEAQVRRTADHDQDA